MILHLIPPIFEPLICNQWDASTRAKFRRLSKYSSLIYLFLLECGVLYLVENERSPQSIRIVLGIFYLVEDVKVLNRIGFDDLSHNELLVNSILAHYGSQELKNLKHLTELR